MEKHGKLTNFYRQDLKQNTINIHYTYIKFNYTIVLPSISDTSIKEVGS